MLISKKKIWNADNSYLIKYKNKIDTGEIIVGSELYQELENLIDDFKNDRYYYDTTKAKSAFDFMENCIRLTKSPFYNKPMKLMLWQKAWIETLYSFKMADTGLDRFKKTILLIARKNGKSETASALANDEFINGNEGSDICCSSNDDAQSSLVYDAINMMRQLYDPKDKDTKRNQRFILNKITNTKVFKMSDKTKNKEGRNIDFAIIDETHEMKENIIAKSIEQSQSLKENPKLINITTEGFVVDGFLDDELRKARRVIAKEDTGINAERLLPWLYTQDSELEVWQGNRENRLWEKSNPTLGTVKRWEYLEEQVDIAKTSKSDRVFVLSKDFNIKQGGGEAWLNLEDYDYKAVYNLEDFRGCLALGGVDMSETTDLTCAKVLIMKRGDKTKYIHTMYFIPKSKLTDSDDKTGGAKYQEWIEKGYITVYDGGDIDLSIVADWFYSLHKDYGINLWKCGYDQRFSRDWIKKMESYYWRKSNGDLVLIPQNKNTLSNAMKLCESDFRHAIINYNENPVDKWCLGNAGIEVNSLGQCWVVKLEKQKRIDGAVALIIAYEMFRQYRTEYKKIVEQNN